ncbi:MAG TPA: NADP-dependent malic enzyme [Methanospirillum sp.]|jgi:malate dehydrogenase (oxaloacetate-decarboxylating)|uniref:NAD(P)-dependent malic enzyme n=1 Tax=Methanospirillum sp. TaxID=45200 RepID=UPI0009D2A54C|nr:NADP-dependent malic enzyme [Methanospirillum sp.]OQB38083.1 MAG: bifunctional malic enzyme oxidoreductase/phosphotransacetylase [Euryarchaeota archaeon ADurb.Bin165]HPY60218.1 NADP-dependent malic enzyme [Methanospirillum sp.]
MDAHQEEIAQQSLRLHLEHQGKLSVHSKVPVKTREDLSLAYTPGVAHVCKYIAKDEKRAYSCTLKHNTIAIITDGTAVLGLGNIGPTAAIPVMEGKAILFKEFAGIDAFPICISGDPDDLIGHIRSIAPVFGGINLEDIAAPRCFEIEEELQNLGIPVMHDDQHGAAIAVLAALLNACKVTGKRFEDLTVVISGAGAAGYAICRLLKCIGYEDESCIAVKELIVCDREGIIYRGRQGLYHNIYKYLLGNETNIMHRTGTLADALRGADVFVGVSSGGLVTSDMVRSMNPDPIVFALSNPVPEIMPDEARAGGAAIVGTGRSDFPNQVNNVLVFPGVFRGALDAGATQISEEMKIAAAHAIAGYVKDPTPEKILPDPLDRGVAQVVAAAVAEMAKKCGCVREE